MPAGLSFHSSRVGRSAKISATSRSAESLVSLLDLRRAFPSCSLDSRLAIALAVSADTLLFDPDDRGPSDDLRLQFEAVAQFDPEARKVAKTVLDGLILQYQARRFATGNGLGER